MTQLHGCAGNPEDKQTNSSERPLDRVLSKLEGVKGGFNNQFSAFCPAHEDNNPSLSVTDTSEGKVLIKCHSGCDVESIVQAIGLSMSDLFPHVGVCSSSPPQTTATVQPPGCSLEEYAHDKDLSVDFLKVLGLSNSKYRNQNRVAIHYNEAGDVIATRYRCALSKSPEGGTPRFVWKTGSRTSLYGLWRLKEFHSEKFVVLVEGESDTQTLWYHGFPALGLPGANHWREEYANYLDGFETIFVVVEPDNGGETILKWISQSRLKDKIRLLSLEPFKDPSEVHQYEPIEFDDFIKTAMERALPWLTKERERKVEQSLEAFSQCKDLAKTPDILGKFAEDLEGTGAIEVEREGKILFLSLTSRLLERPLSVIVKGPSSAGKSFLVGKVQQFFPPSAFYFLSSMTAKSLFFIEESLEHRMLSVSEFSGAENDMTVYVLRTLLSEGHIKHLMVDKGTKGLHSRSLEKSGPTGLIVTTTRNRIDQEIETRMLSITLRDSREQTRLIIQQLAKKQNSQVRFDDWHALQTWLEQQDNRVSIPYAERLAELIPPVAVRLRRDFHQILALIQTHAILHQTTRQRSSDGEIIATLADYTAIRDLIGDIIQQEVGFGVSQETREVVEAVRAVLEGKGPNTTVNQTEIQQFVNLEKSSLSRRVRGVIRDGYLANQEEHRGKPYRLVLGEPLPDEVAVLPDPKELLNWPL
jgi:hypothetical protein